MGDWTLLLLTTLGGVAALAAWDRWRPAAPAVTPAVTPGVTPGRGTDLLIAGLVGVAAYGVFRLTHAAFNPAWTPTGQDNHDYYACIVAFRFGELELWSPARYPLYPALVAAADVLTGLPLWRVALELSLLTSALLPASVYLLGRVFAARPVAIAGALLTLHLPSHLFMLASPTDYPLAAALYTLSFAALVRMVQVGSARHHALAGALLALYFAATPKAFPMLLLGVLAVGIGQLAGRKLAPRAMVVFAAPLLLTWVGFALLDLPLFPLEHNLYGVQSAADWFDPALPFPDVGWAPSDPDLHGYWVPGTLRAILHLPDVLQYLLDAPVHAMTLRERLDVFLPLMAEELAMGGMSALVLASLLGTFGAWRGGHPTPRSAAAVALAGLIALTHLWGQGAAPYTQRYALPLLVTTPVLVLAAFAWPTRGAVGHRVALVFLPLIAAVAWVLGPSPGPLGMRQIEGVMEPWAYARSPLDALPAIRERLEPGDAVVDASATNMMAAFLDGEPITLTRGRVLLADGRATLDFPATPAAHRYLVLGCLNEGELPPEHANEQLRRQLTAEGDRFEAIARCVWQDAHPERPYPTPD